MSEVSLVDNDILSETQGRAMIVFVVLLRPFNFIIQAYVFLVCGKCLTFLLILV